MFEYKEFLIFIWINSLIFYYLKKSINFKYSNIFAYCLSALSFFYAAFRSDSFVDYQEYISIYELAKTGDFNNPAYWLTHSEPGFKILIFFLSLINENHIILFLFMAFLSFILLIYINNKLNLDYAYTWFFYLSFFFVTRDLGVIRLSIASHLIVISLISSNYYKKVFIAFIASSIFQYLSFLPTVMSILVKKTEPKISTFFILLIFAIFLSIFIDFNSIDFLIPDKTLMNYQDTEFITARTNNPTLAILRNLIVLLISLFFIKDYIKDDNKRILIWMSFFSVFIYILFNNIPLLSQRTGAYFGVVTPYLLTYAIANKKNQLAFWAVTIFSSLIFLTTLYTSDLIR